ncbi:MAG: AIR synthase family protein [Anaerolineales bacterium]|nr:AIR synthase family protein [Anaerolineales bacterium]
MLGPGIGLDCALIDAGDSLIALKSDPITFATDEIGWYAVQVNANDIATTGATPRWFLATLLLPARDTTAGLVEMIFQQLQAACQEIGVTIVGGHTEITHGLQRPILVGTMIGEVRREELVTARGARPGDLLLLTKGAPIEATAILAREFPDKLLRSGVERGGDPGLSESELKEAQAFLYQPGISVLRDARIAAQAGKVHAMHDPTEGGLYAALWELAEACGHALALDLGATPVPPLSARICRILGLDPLGAIASGALLLAASPGEADKIQRALEAEGIACTQIGEVLEKEPALSPELLAVQAPGRQHPLAWLRTPGGLQALPYPERDEIARLFSN